MFLEMHMNFRPLEMVSEDNKESYVYQPTAGLLTVKHTDRGLISSTSLKSSAGTPMKCSAF